MLLQSVDYLKIFFVDELKTVNIKYCGESGGGSVCILRIGLERPSSSL